MSSDTAVETEMLILKYAHPEAELLSQSISLAILWSDIFSILSAGISRLSELQGIEKNVRIP